jgi:hypothetical protein
MGNKMQSSHTLHEVLRILSPDETFQAQDSWATYTIGRDGDRYYGDLSTPLCRLDRVFFLPLDVGSPFPGVLRDIWVPIHVAARPGVTENTVYVPLNGWARV